MTSDTLVLSLVAGGTGLAAVIDLRTRRVPNVLTVTLAAIGVAIAAAGLGRVGVGASILGCLLGLAFMLPGHLIGGTGAGDVKLFAAAGALLGPADTVQAFINTAIAGGVVALVVAIHRRRVRQTVGGTARLIAQGSGAGIDNPESDNRFAYAPAIAIGVVMVALGW